jgi:hypothetical protein
MVFQLTYVSTAAQDFDRPALLQLLEGARVHNQRAGLTGLLLYKKGQFLQVLEGAKQEVLALYGRIQKDPRHGGVVTVLSREVPERAFPDWSMAFFDLADSTLASRPGFSTLLNSDLSAPPAAPEESMVQLLVRVFRQR